MFIFFDAIEKKETKRKETEARNYMVAKDGAAMAVVLANVSKSLFKVFLCTHVLYNEYA